MRSDIQRVFDDIEGPQRDTLLAARDLIFDCAGDIAVVECLKWGQPSYVAPKGSTLRLGVNKAGKAAIYAHCQSSIISDFVAQFGADFEIEGNRAVLLGAFEQADQDKLRALIQRMILRVQVEFDKLMEDPETKAIHREAVNRHRAKIDELRATEKYTEFYKDLTGDRLKKLSRLHSHFGSNVFLSGPDVIPDDVAQKDPDSDFFFTVEKGETIH